VRRPLWREDGSAVCSAITQWSESLRTRNHTLLSHLRLPQPGGPGSLFISPRNRMYQLYPRALGSLYVVSYDSQGYGGGILTLPLPEGQVPLYIAFRNRMVQSKAKSIASTCRLVLLRDGPNSGHSFCYCCVGRLPVFTNCGRFPWKASTQVLPNCVSNT
jgi:hypothetical protein